MDVILWQKQLMRSIQQRAHFRPKATSSNSCLSEFSYLKCLKLTQSIGIESSTLFYTYMRLICIAKRRWGGISAAGDIGIDAEVIVWVVPSGNFTVSQAFAFAITFSHFFISKMNTICFKLWISEIQFIFTVPMGQLNWLEVRYKVGKTNSSPSTRSKTPPHPGTEYIN